jgi:hypothetical protein
VAEDGSISGGRRSLHALETREIAIEADAARIGEPLTHGVQRRGGLTA